MKRNLRYNLARFDGKNKQKTMDEIIHDKNYLWTGEQISQVASGEVDIRGMDGRVKKIRVTQVTDGDDFTFLIFEDFSFA